MTHLDEVGIRSALSGSPFVANLVERDVCGSTNDDLHALAARGAPEGTVVTANAQTAGRGRLERVWHSPPALGLYLSTLHRPNRPANELARWTLASAVAACEACRDVANVAASIKWPNDVLANGKKLAGVLAEARTTGTHVAWLVIGTGFNVNQLAADFPPAIRDDAVSLRILTGGRLVNRGLLARAYLDRLGSWSDHLAQGRFDPVADAWHRLAPEGNGVRVRWVGTVPGSPVSGRKGVTRGLDETGALRVEVDDGSVIVVRIGESLAAEED